VVKGIVIPEVGLEVGSLVGPRVGLVDGVGLTVDLLVGLNDCLDDGLEEGLAVLGKEVGVAHIAMSSIANATKRHIVIQKFIVIIMRC
jgi:hypothetical protein